jgi:hypothetical protein
MVSWSLPRVTTSGQMQRRNVLMGSEERTTGWKFCVKAKTQRRGKRNERSGVTRKG